jgi:hypothetical protein
LIFSRCYSKWLSSNQSYASVLRCIRPHKNSLIYSVQKTLITDEALLHVKCQPDKLLQYASAGKLSYSLP